MTIRDLIRRTFTLIGVLSEGETPSSEMQVDAFQSLKEMLESWSLESLTIPAVVREEFDMIPGQGIYTLGSGGDFSTLRPVYLERAAVIENGVEVPIDLMNLDQWAEISDRATQSNLPTDLYLEGTSPFSKVHLYPVPSAANKLVLYSQKSLSTFATVNDSLSFPPGYTRAIRYNFAIELADEYSRPVPAGVAMIAAKSLGNIKRINSKPIYLTPDSTSGASGRGFNIITGE